MDKASAQVNIAVPRRFPTELRDQELTFIFNGKFNIAVKQLKDQARRAMTALLRKSRQLQLPISCQLDLFNSLVMPILTYGCEVWGNNCVDIAESLHLEYCKYILRLKKSTPNCFIYGETGRFPLFVHVYCRMIKFWQKLSIDTLTSKKFYSRMLNTLTECFNLQIHKNDWLLKMKLILDGNGLSFLCYSIPMLKLRTSNHKLPIEKGRHMNIPQEARLCHLCDINRVGAEYHFVMECPVIQNLRNQYLPKYYRTRPNFHKYATLMSISSQKKVTGMLGPQPYRLNLTVDQLLSATTARIGFREMDRERARRPRNNLKLDIHS
ncbi:uncharacterized protein LOC143285948 [Babylonia areolata]|uniref:uncharacterized protein LOC143285948 n=1 Tax=Babylonia areolata TaxID=304850 RepID=UPI003FD26DB8